MRRLFELQDSYMGTAIAERRNGISWVFVSVLHGIESSNGMEVKESNYGPNGDWQHTTPRSEVLHRTLCFVHHLTHFITERRHRISQLLLDISALRRRHGTLDWRLCPWHVWVHGILYLLRRGRNRFPGRYYAGTIQKRKPVSTTFLVSSACTFTFSTCTSCW